MFPVVGLLAAPALLSSAPQQELTLQQVLKANTAALNAIRSIHVTIEVSSNYPVPGDEHPPEPQPTWTYEWYKDGARERVRQNLLRGQGPHNHDTSNGPKGYKSLQNYDPNIDPPPSESWGGRAGGVLDKTQTDNALGGPVRAMSFMSNLPGGTLEEYVAKYPSSKLAATPATSKRGCYEIITLSKKPQIAGSSYDVRDVRIFVDPKVGFWVRRIEQGPWQKSTDPGDKGTNSRTVATASSGRCEATLAPACPVVRVDWRLSSGILCIRSTSRCRKKTLRSTSRTGSESMIGLLAKSSFGVRTINRG